MLIAAEDGGAIDVVHEWTKESEDSDSSALVNLAHTVHLVRTPHAACATTSLRVV